MDISKITNIEARRFINAFSTNRTITREYYELVSEEQFDFRMVDTSERKSDTPRESLRHQIGVQTDYINDIVYRYIKI